MEKKWKGEGRRCDHGMTLKQQFTHLIVESGGTAQRSFSLTATTELTAVDHQRLTLETEQQ